MSKVDLYMLLKVYENNCESSEDCLDIKTGTSDALKKEKVTIAASDSLTIFSPSSTETRTLFIKSDSNFQININALGNKDVKRMPFGTSFKEAFFLSRMDFDSIELTNPSGTDELEIEYTLA